MRMYARTPAMSSFCPCRLAVANQKIKIYSAALLLIQSSALFERRKDMLEIIRLIIIINNKWLITGLDARGLTIQKRKRNVQIYLHTCNLKVLHLFWRKFRALFSLLWALQGPDLPLLLYSSLLLLSVGLRLSCLQVVARFIHLDVSHGAGGGMRFDQDLRRHWAAASVIGLAHSRIQTRPMVELDGVFFFSFPPTNRSK